MLEEHAGHVHQQPRRPQPGGHRLAQRQHVLLPPDIAAEIDLTRDVGRGNGETVFGQATCDGAADRAAGPRDHGHPSRHYASSPSARVIAITATKRR